MVGWTPSWSQQADQFDWLSAYFNERGLQTRWRLATGVFVLVFSAIPMVMLRSPHGPDSDLTIAMSVVASGFGVGAALLWLFRWPSRRQSVLFCTLATVSIAVTCLAQSDPYSGLMGGTVFAVIGGFAGYFHTVGHLIANFAVAAATSIFLTFRLIESTGDVALAGSSLLTVAALNIGVPFGIHSLMNALRRDLRHSDHDGLTGLLTRRAFQSSTYEMIMREAGSGNYLVVTMIDLDNFKNLNDTRGHQTGDQALAAVGTALRENCGPTAVIGRAGGEEFVVADANATPYPADRSERIRRAIAAVPFEVTASIGTASTPIDAGAATANLAVISDLIRASDEAMYEAKRAGGNQVRHRQLVAEKRIA